MQVRRRNRRNIKHVSAHLTMRSSEPTSGAPARPISTKHLPPAAADLDWRRVMANDDEAFLNIHSNRSKEAFCGSVPGEIWDRVDEMLTPDLWLLVKSFCDKHRQEH